MELGRAATAMGERAPSRGLRARGKNCAKQRASPSRGLKEKYQREDSWSGGIFLPMSGARRIRPRAKARRRKINKGVAADDFF
jgi:hypothetical protein